MGFETGFGFLLGQVGKGPQDLQVAGDPAEAVAALETIRLAVQTAAEPISKVREEALLDRLGARRSRYGAACVSQRP